MATLIPHYSQLHAIRGACCFFCSGFPCFESLHEPCTAVERRLICQTWWNVAVNWTPRNSEKWLPCRKGKMMFPTLVSPSNCVATCALLAVQGQNMCFIILQPTSVQKLELWIPKTTVNRKGCIERLHMQQAHQAIMLQKDVSSIARWGLKTLWLGHCFPHIWKQWQILFYHVCSEAIQ